VRHPVRYTGVVPIAATALSAHPGPPWPIGAVILALAAVALTCLTALPETAAAGAVLNAKGTG
jgi:hypothetical protein